MVFSSAGGGPALPAVLALAQVLPEILSGYLLGTEIFSTHRVESTLSRDVMLLRDVTLSCDVTLL